MGAPLNSRVMVNIIYRSASRVSAPLQFPPQHRRVSLPSFGSSWTPGIEDTWYQKSGIPVVFGFQAPLTGYWMDSYIMIIWIRLGFIASPNKHTNTIVLVIPGCAKFFDWQEGASGYGVHAPSSEHGYMRDSCRAPCVGQKRTRQSSRAVRS